MIKIAFSHRDKSRHSHSTYICKCKTVTVARDYDVKKGLVKSCGCLRNNTAKKIHTKHGQIGSKTYLSWKAMKHRCNNPNAINYKYYGDRGIKVCKRWINSFENFYADMGKRPKGKTIDRINNDGNYTPSNCKWSTQKQQVYNRG